MKTLLAALLLVQGAAQEIGKSVGVSPRATAVGAKAIYTGSYALFVGIGSYSNQGIPSIPSAPNDARAIRELLIQKYGFDPSPDRSVLLIDRQATKERIEFELARLCDPKRVRRTDRVFVFFSCHGQSIKTLDGDDHGYILPYGAQVNFADINDASGYQTSCIKMDDMVGKLAECNANHRVVVLDACFSGLAVHKDITSRTEFDPATVQDDLNERGLYVLTAGTAKQETFGTSNPEGLSVFSRAFAETLKENSLRGKAAFIEQVAFDAGERTVTASKGRQRPTPLPKSGVGSMLLVPLTALTRESAPPPVNPNAAFSAKLDHAGSKLGETLLNPKDDTEFVWVPGGRYPFGATGARETLSGFWIAKTDVTWGQYKRFCQDTNRPMPSLPPFPITDDHPVVNVSWRDAFDYCEWAGGQLPTEEQWEFAARGEDGRRYPWGAEFDGKRCHTSVGADKKTGTAPVGSYPSGASFAGCLDMAGNVNQWTSSPLDKSNKYCVIRGGSWMTKFADGAESSKRPFSVVSYKGPDLGFRVSGPIVRQ